MTSERTPLVDQLRGLALFGITLVNAPFFANGLEGFTDVSYFALRDRLASEFVLAFATGKFYLIFSFLFGYSAFRFINIESSWGRAKFQRRLVVLATMGVLHAWCLFIGDILFGYALLGLVLLFLSNYGPNHRLKVGFGLIALGFALYTVTSLAIIMSSPSASSADLQASAFDRVMVSGNFVEGLIARMRVWPAVQLALGFLNYIYALAMMCLGSVAAHRGAFESSSHDCPVWRNGRKIGFPIGLILSVVFATVNADWADLLVFAFAPLLAWGYVSFIVLAHSNEVKWLKAFNAAGRMSMTCYLLMSLCLSAIFCGWGLAWFGKLGSTAVSLIALTTCTLTELVGSAYLKRYDQGPLEALVSRLIAPKRQVA